MGQRDVVIVYVYICVFAFMLGNSKEETAATENSEYSSPPSGDIIMMEDAEEVFYNVDLKKYDDMGIQCPDPVPPDNGAIIGEGSRVGTVLYLECHDGYELQGPKIMACVPVSDGAQWDPLSPSACLAVSVPISMSTLAHGSAPKAHGKKSIRRSPSLTLPRYPTWATTHGHNNVDLVKEESWEAGARHQLTPPFCMAKPETGPCRASLRRYYFNKTTKECRTFFYGGCHGNENNFQTRKDCKIACLGKE